MAMEKPQPEVVKAIEAMKGRFPATPDQLIPMLQFVQAELGYLPSEGMAAIAEYLRAPASHVYGVATFYTQFRFKPLGKNRFTVCRGTACHVRGSGKLVDDIERELGIKAGDTSADMMFSLQTVACFGSCALAPVILVNDKVYGKVTSKSVKQLIGNIKGETPSEAPIPEKKAPAAKSVEAKAPAPAAKPAKKAPAKIKTAGKKKTVAEKKILAKKKPAAKKIGVSKKKAVGRPVPGKKSAATKAAKAKPAAARKKSGKTAPKPGPRFTASKKKSAAAGKKKRK